MPFALIFFCKSRVFSVYVITDFILITHLLALIFAFELIAAAYCKWMAISEDFYIVLIHGMQSIPDRVALSWLRESSKLQGHLHL